MAAPPSSDPPRQLVLVFVLAAVTAMLPFSMDMYLPALPTIGREFSASAGGMQMTVAIFFVGTALGQLVFGPISDRLGRRKPAIFGLVVYIVASLGCAWAHNLNELLAFRLLQALGVCSGQVVARAMLADLFAPRDLARFSALLSMITLMAPIIGPLAGGLLFTHFGWRLLFLVLTAYGVMVLVAVAFHLPETRSLDARAVSRLESPWQGYIAILKNWPLLRLGLAGGCSSCAIVVYVANSPHVIIEHFGVPANQFGFYFAANSVGLYLGSQINRRLLRSHHPEQILSIACWVYLGAALVMTAGAIWSYGGKWMVLVPLFVTMATFPAVIGNSTALAQGLDRQRGGQVAAVLGGLQGLIGAGAVAIGSSFGDGSPLAMALTMAGAAAVATALFLRATGPAAAASS